MPDFTQNQKDKFQVFVDDYITNIDNEKKRQDQVADAMDELEDLMRPEFLKKKKKKGMQMISEETEVIYEGAESLLKRGLPLQGSGPYSIRTSGGQTMDANEFIKTLSADTQAAIKENTQRFAQGKGPIAPPNIQNATPSQDANMGTSAQSEELGLDPFKLEPRNPLNSGD